MTDKERLEKIEEAYKMLQEAGGLSIDDILKLLKDDKPLPLGNYKIV